MDSLVSTQWLAENLDNSNLVLLDASVEKVVGKEPIVYEAPVFIPTSRKFCLDSAFCNLDSQVVHAFPTQKQFEVEAQKLGISTDSIVVIYDNQGIYSSPRAWWIFQAMGFTNAYVLDGGLPKWLAENRSVVSSLDKALPKAGNVKGIYNSQLVCDANYVFENMNNNSVTVLDARSKDRYLGLSPEPRAGVRSGHIPNSVSLPFDRVLENGCFKTHEELAKVLSDLLDTSSHQLVFSCGSGITACIILMAARLAGYSNTVLYDGSWSEWGGDSSLPIE